MSNLNIHFQLFPSGTRVTPPVAILQKAISTIMGSKPMVLLSHKVIFPDGTETVIAAETRQLWAGADGAAFDVAPGTRWKVAAASRGGIIVNHAGGFLGAQT